ncbi:MAG: phosphopentomutase [Peptococcaceae bacterium BICA1-7]|nr:MAG: phosphopentomutase [Peptococcaceae bacterium BICA1-7]HBV96886.1 phosphopentomutase [Desulfotomaculum sp.]
MKQVDRVIIIVLDSVGIGSLPDAFRYGDEGSNTLGNCAHAVNGLNMPQMEKLGLGNLGDFMGIGPSGDPAGAYGKMACQSPGKDTTTGHWEISGIILNRPFPVYPNGFPREIIDQFIQRTGVEILGNKAASGTEIIKELGEEHVRTGRPIVYTSADSVFQIAAHEEVIPLERLYEMCRIARAILTGENAVGRVIARPFTGEPGNFVRTMNRHDFSLEPGPNILTQMSGEGLPVLAVGKISDIFSGVGITRAIHTTNNTEGVDRTVELIRDGGRGLIFTNLVEFDMVYGHRNDPRGYARALEEFDRRIPEITGALNKNDILIITADHGCDPTTPGTDHSREYVPLIITGNSVRPGVNLGIRQTFADVAATLAEIFSLKWETGKSFAGEILS